MASQVLAANQNVFAATMRRDRVAMVLANPNLPDCPIVYVNPAFEELTGYQAGAVVGRNCRFLQGPDTDPGSVGRIRHALSDRAPITEKVYNYRRDGSGFWNVLYMSPVFGSDGELAYFFASQVDAGARGESHEEISARELELRCQLTLARRLAAETDALWRETEYRGENGLRLVRSALEEQARSLDDLRARQVMYREVDRIELLEKIQQQIRHGSDVFGSDTRAYLLNLVGNLQDIQNAGARKQRERTISLAAAEDLTLAPRRLMVLGVVATELITDALLHGSGSVHLRVEHDSRAVVVAVSHDGSDYVERPDRVLSAYRPGLRLVAELGLPGGISVSSTAPYETSIRIAA